MEIINLIIALGGLLATVWGIIYALRIQGSYKKADLCLKALSAKNLASGSIPRKDYDFLNNEAKISPTISVYNDLDSGKRDVKVILYQPLLIENSGKLAAEDVTIQLFYPYDFSCETISKFKYEEFLSKVKNGLARTHFQTIERYGCTTITIPLLAAKDFVEFYEEFLFDSQIFKKPQSNFEKLFLKDDDALRGFPVHYSIKGKNFNTREGTFYIFYFKHSYKSFFENYRPTISVFAEKFHPNYKRAFSGKAKFILYPHKWFSFLYKKQFVRFLVTTRELDTVSSDEEKPEFVYETFLDTIVTYNILDYSLVDFMPKLSSPRLMSDM